MIVFSPLINDRTQSPDKWSYSVPWSDKWSYPSLTSGHWCVPCVVANHWMNLNCSYVILSRGWSVLLRTVVEIPVGPEKSFYSWIIKTIVVSSRTSLYFEGSDMENRKKRLWVNKKHSQSQGSPVHSRKKSSTLRPLLLSAFECQRDHLHRWSP